MAQKVKVPFLETSPEKFQPKDGSGSYRSGCPTPTGNRLSAILQAPPASSSPTDDQLKSPSDDSLGEMEERVKTEYDNFTKTSGLRRSCWDDLDEPEKRLHRKWYLERLVGRENGVCGAIDYDLLLFWNHRIPVRMKG